MTPTEQTNHELTKITNTIAVMRLDSVENTQRLALVDELRENVELLQRAIVTECRTCGMTWEAIGQTLGTSKQNVQQRFG